MRNLFSKRVNKFITPGTYHTVEVSKMPTYEDWAKEMGVGKLHSVYEPIHTDIINPILSKEEVIRIKQNQFKSGVPMPESTLVEEIIETFKTK